MQKVFVLFICMFLALPAFSEAVVNSPLNTEESKPLEASITFDWISKTQLQRDENIKQIQNILFSEEVKTKYNKKDFKEIYKNDWKDKSNLKNYEEIGYGKKEDENNYYCGFYKWNLLVAYGIQHKKDLNNVYYYDALGNLRWVEVFGGNYPTYPYWSYQYYRDGKLVAAYYNLSSYDQYIFDSNKKFIGRAYKQNIYNSKAKVIMTRTSY